MGLFDWARGAMQPPTPNWTDEDVEELNISFVAMIRRHTSQLLTEYREAAFSRMAAVLRETDCASEQYESVVQGVLYSCVEEIQGWEETLITSLNALCQQKKLSSMQELYSTYPLPSDFRAIIVADILDAGGSLYDSLLEEIKHGNVPIEAKRIEEYERMWLLPMLAKERTVRESLQLRVLSLLEAKEFVQAGRASANYVLSRAELVARREARRFRRLFGPVFHQVLSDGAGVSALGAIANRTDAWRDIVKAWFPAFDENNMSHRNAAGAFIGLWRECERISEEIESSVISDIGEETGSAFEALGLTAEKTREAVHHVVQEAFNGILGDYVVVASNAMESVSGT